MQIKENVNLNSEKHFFSGYLIKLAWIFFLLIYSFDDITHELFHKYDAYTSLTFRELIDQGYDEDDSLLNSLNFHEEICLFINESSYTLDDEKLTAIKDRKSRPLKASSIIDFSKDSYSYRIETIYEKGLMNKKSMLISWSDNDLFQTDHKFIDFIFDKLNLEIKSQDIQNIFLNEYKMNRRGYNKNLGDIIVRINVIDHKYVCFVGNEKKMNNIDLLIDDFISK